MINYTGVFEIITKNNGEITTKFYSKTFDSKFLLKNRADAINWINNMQEVIEEANKLGVVNMDDKKLAMAFNGLMNFDEVDFNNISFTAVYIYCEGKTKLFGEKFDIYGSTYTNFEGEEFEDFTLNNLKALDLEAKTILKRYPNIEIDFDVYEYENKSFKVIDHFVEQTLIFV